jgi:prepilin-type processing-associated H-X9-DG protein
MTRIPAMPYQAQLSDIVDIQGYSNCQYGGFNGGNVLFWDGSWILYFFDNSVRNPHVFRATRHKPCSFAERHWPPGVIQMPLLSSQLAILGT